MITFPNAKINLGLEVLSKRKDGYHNIESGFYPIPWKDGLEIVESDDFQFSSSGLEIPGNPEENLCVKAYYLLKSLFKIPPVQIHLHKVIPMGAGLGGGSADGAFTLKLLNDKFRLNLEYDRIENFAAQLGSDCAFFIRNEAALASGKGEKLTPLNLDLSKLWIVLINPGVHISTREAYSGVRITKPSDLSSLLNRNKLLSWKGLLTNSFEHSIADHYPVIKELKDLLYDHGALYASMTGSGSTVYGLFEKVVELEPSIHNNFNVWSSQL